jgi:hypothetical protein
MVREYRSPEMDGLIKTMEACNRHITLEGKRLGSARGIERNVRRLASDRSRNCTTTETRLNDFMIAAVALAHERAE